MTAKKTKVIFDESSDKALFIEQLKNPSEAIMYPVNQGAIFWRIAKRKMAINNIKRIGVVLIYVGLYLIALTTGLSEANDSMGKFIVYALLIGFGVLSSFCFTKSCDYAFNEDYDQLAERYARNELRNMKSQSSNNTVDEYFIKSSFMYSGTDGDFITWYKQEKNKRDNASV